MKKTLDFDYEYGDVVYFRVADKRMPGLVTGLHLTQKYDVVYVVSWGSGESSNHWACELTDEYIPEDWHQSEE